MFIRLDRLLSLSPDVLSAKVAFREADFFTFSVPENDLFDLVYDYTSASIPEVMLTVPIDQMFMPGSLSPSRLLNVLIGDI